MTGTAPAGIQVSFCLRALALLRTRVCIGQWLQLRTGIGSLVQSLLGWLMAFVPSPNLADSHRRVQRTPFCCDEEFDELHRSGLGCLRALNLPPTKRHFAGTSPCLPADGNPSSNMIVPKRLGTDLSSSDPSSRAIIIITYFRSLDQCRSH